MENRLIKEFNTTAPMPLYLYKVLINYNEVKKASGIAYILLDLILKENGSDDSFGYVLSKFGIPKDLHYIFAKELLRLKQNKIISSNYEDYVFDNSKYFSEIKINEINLTTKGKKLFKDGAIPTGEEKIKEAKIYFSPVTKEFDIKSSMPFSNFSTCALNQSFVDKIKVDLTPLEDYLNANKTKVGLKAEEAINSFTKEIDKYLIVRQSEGLKISIYEDDVQFSFKTKAELDFFIKYFSANDIETFIDAKNKYKFSGGNIKIKNTDMSIINQNTIAYLPYESATVGERTTLYSICKNRMSGIGNKAKYRIKDEEALEVLEELDDYVEFVLIDDNVFKEYTPAILEIPAPQINSNIHFSLLLENTVDLDKQEIILNKLFNKQLELPYASENKRAIRYLAKKLGEKRIYDEYLDNKIKDEEIVDSKISILLKMNNDFNGNDYWDDLFIKKGLELYKLSLNECQLDNIIYKKNILSPLLEKLNIPHSKFIEEIIDVLKNEDKDLIFQALEGANFNINTILGFINVCKPYMKSVLSNKDVESDTVISNSFKILRQNLWGLNNLLGIKKCDDYLIDEDINMEVFFKQYKGLIDSYNSLKKYENFDIEGFKEFELYLDIIKPVHEVLSIEKLAYSHPEKITKKYIDDLIVRGQYKNAICEMHVKSQGVIRSILNLSTGLKACLVINEAENAKLIGKKEASLLNELRNCRNEFEHPKGIELNLNEAKIKEWEKTVFEVGEGK